ncbi:MAG TPA: thiamine pyrophosphate-dependent enzyme [Patescibacteria group bacterium]|nr:thiamine pyrophosphate-dependent enzyme [Patescibacteria group bacterium]
MEHAAGDRFEFLSGNEALAQGAYEAGLKVACAYPGTPSSEILEFLSRFKEVDSQWSVNEKVAFEVALAASIAGVRSLYASKQVGLNVAMDPLMTSAYTGVGAGFVVVSCDDPGIHSSQNEQDTRLFAKVAKVPLLEPSSPSEAKEFIQQAFQISEAFDTPVIVRMTTRISHTKENVAVGHRTECAVKEFKTDIAKYVMVPRNAYRKHIELEKKLIKLQAFSEKTSLNKVEPGTKSLGFLTAGVAYLYAKEMYPQASFLKLGMSFPFPEKKARGFAKKVKRLFVVEELEPFLEEQLSMRGIRAKAKHPSFRVGELRPEFLPQIVAGRPKGKELPASRKPVMCPGCLHRSVFWVLKKLKMTVTGDIGCYTLGALSPLESLHTCVCMGAGVTFFEGFRRAGLKNVVGVIGDSTFVHSGITGLVNLAYNKTKGVLIILDNGTTAMTGSQPHPAVGLTLGGEPTRQLDLKEVCLACGADNVDIIDPYDVRRAEALIRERMQQDALSVIIARSACRLLDRARAAIPVWRKENCKKCYLCLGIDCPAIRKTEEGLVAIDSAVCTGCNLCVEVCAFGALLKNEES